MPASTAATVRPRRGGGNLMKRLAIFLYVIGFMVNTMCRRTELGRHA